MRLVGRGGPENWGERSHHLLVDFPSNQEAELALDVLSTGDENYRAIRLGGVTWLLTQHSKAGCECLVFHCTVLSPALSSQGAFS